MRLLTAQIMSLAKRRGLTKPILWIAIPTAVEVVGRMNESLMIYHVSDKYDANTMDHATDPAFIRKLHERAIDAADLVFYSSRKLLDEATSGREKSHLLEQAVDFDHWSRISNGELKIAEAVEQSAAAYRYCGAIEPWLIDQTYQARSLERTDGTDLNGNKSRAWRSRTCRTSLAAGYLRRTPRYADGWTWSAAVESRCRSRYGSAIRCANSSPRKAL